MIGFAFKPLEGMTLHAAQQALQESLEADMVFAGVLLFENRLKPTAVQSVQDIQAAGMHCSIITGDHVLTAVAVAKQCGILTAGPLYVCMTSKDGPITWTNPEDPTATVKVCVRASLLQRWVRLVHK